MGAEVRAWFSQHLEHLLHQAGSPSLRDLARSMAHDASGPINVFELAREVGLAAKPLSHSTIHDLIRCKNASAPDAWTVSMFVLACVCWGAAHGAPVLPELTTGAVQGLLRQWQQRRTDYETLLLTSAKGTSRADTVRVGLVPMLADRYQRRSVGLALDRAVEESGTVVLAQSSPTAGTTLLAGSGGVGKTQLAAEFARRVWPDPRVRLAIWTTADSRSAIADAYADAAARILGVDPSEPDLAARHLLAWLATTDERWLVVLDDLQRPEDLHGLWPDTDRHGQVVVTTRRRDPSLRRDDRAIVDVDVFSPEESLAYLTAKLAEHPEFMRGAAELADILGHLPLALAQAVAYQLNRNLSCAQYVDRFLDRGKTLADVLPDRDELPDDHQRTIATAWSLSVDLADSLKPARLARPLLKLISFLDPAGAPLTMFTTDVTLAHVAEAAGARVDADTIRDALGTLHRLSLITLYPAETIHGVQAHGLVQRTTYDTMSIPERAVAVDVAANAVMEVWPRIDTAPGLEQVLRANSEAINNAAGDLLWVSTAYRVLFRAGNSLGDSGSSTAAWEWYRRLHDTAARRLGADHRATLTARHGCAYWRAVVGDLVGAIAEFEGVLADQHRVLGPDDPETMITRSNLASLRGEAGDPRRAVTELEAVLADQHRVLGPDEYSAVATRSKLARWRWEAGDLLGAVTEREAILTAKDHVLGPRHPETLSARDSLARARGLAGDSAGAVAELEVIVTDHHEALGANHPYTLTARHNLACWRGKAGDPQAAVTELELLVVDDTRVLGPDHPDTLLTRNNLASWRGEAGNPTGAIAELESLVEDRARVFGPAHPDTLITRSNLYLWRSRLSDGT